MKKLLLLILTCTALFLSCSNALSSGGDSAACETDTSERPYIVFSFGNKIQSQSSRSISSTFTPANFSNVVFAGSDGSGHTVHETAASFSELTGRRIYVDTGNWSFTLTADYGTEKYKANSSATISAGPNPITMNLRADTSASGGVAYNPADHPGSYKVYVAFPADNIDVVHFEIKTLAGVVKHTEEKVKGTDYSGGGPKTIQFISSSFESGSFFISVAFKHISGKDADGNNIYEELNPWGEILTINPGVEATGTITLPKSEPVYSIEYVLNGGEWKSSYDGNITLSYIKTSGDVVSGVKEDYITLPPREVLFYDGYKFMGWYEEADFSGTEVTQFDVSDLINKRYYAKWEEFHGFDLTFTIVNGAGTEYPLTAEQAADLGLQTVHDAENDTELDAPVFDDGESNTIGFNGFYYDKEKTQPVTLSASHYVIPAEQITENSTIYMDLSVHHVYVKYNASEEGGLAFNVNTPAKTVAEAKGWLKGASGSDNIIYVKYFITAKTEVENLSGLSLAPASGGEYGGAILKRHSSLNSSELVKINDNLTLSDLVLDGGADYGTLDSTTSIYNISNSGKNSDKPLLIINSGKTVTLENIVLQNNCNTPITYGTIPFALEIYSGAKVTIKNSKITRCSRALQLRENSGGSNGNVFKMENSEISYNGSKTENIFEIGSANSSVTLDGVSFINNKQHGPALKIGTRSTVNSCTFTGNVNNSNNYGNDIYCTKSLTLDGDFNFTDGNIYIESYNEPLKLTSSFTNTDGSTITLIPRSYSRTQSGATVFDVHVLDFATNSLTDEQIATAKALFELPADATDYLIDDDGYIKPIPGTITVTPGFPGNYVCRWTQTVSGSTRTINIIVEDLDGHPLEVGTAVGNINTVSVGIYEVADLVDEKTLTSSTGLSFEYPAYLDPPSGTPFYVKFNVKVDDTTAYSYDYWPEAGVVALGDGTISISSVTTSVDLGSSVSKVFNSRTLKFPIGDKNKLIASDHEVTQGEYEQYMTYYGRAVSGTTTGAIGSSSPYAPVENEAKTKGYGPNYPVYYINWYEAVMYCNLRSAAEHLTPVYYIMKDGAKVTDVAQWVDETGKLSGSKIHVSDGKYYYKSVNDSSSVLDYKGESDTDGGIRMDLNADGWRLPTEAEWEFLARGGNVNTTGQMRYSGTNSSSELDNYAWYSDNPGTNSQTHEVKGLLPNNLELYDMTGNVSEWCWDWWIDTPETGTDPAGADSGTFHVYRGSAWGSSAVYCPVSYRFQGSAYSRQATLGFRVVRSSD